MSRYDRRLKGLGINDATCQNTKRFITNPFVSMTRNTRQIDARQVDARQVNTRQVNARQIDVRQIDARHVDARQVAPIEISQQNDSPELLQIITKHDKLLQKLLLRFNKYEERLNGKINEIEMKWENNYP